MNKYDKAIAVLNQPKQTKQGFKYSQVTMIATGQELAEVNFIDTIALAVKALRKMEKSEECKSKGAGRKL
ncbi:MAG: hypothetical protein RSA99_01490 [Oscillospiraceae bacterium]